MRRASQPSISAFTASGGSCRVQWPRFSIVWRYRSGQQPQFLRNEQLGAYELALAGEHGIV